MMRNKDAFTILPCGEGAVTIEFSKEIQEETNRKIRFLATELEQRDIPGFIECIPTFVSMTVFFDPLRLSRRKLISHIRNILRTFQHGQAICGRTFRIPVCYEQPFAPDLADVCAHTGLSEQEVIDLHTSRDYLIYMLGFLPGFPYLGGMDPRLETPRLSSPRKEIPTGSVGIGGTQTGIYPLASPGGWRLIGRTPIPVYDPEKEDPILYRAGDSIRFYPITKEEYERYSSEYQRKTSKVEDVPSDGLSLTVLSSGPLSTIQDGGRLGFQSMGFSPGGAMDLFSMKQANLLVGNDPMEATIEMTLLGMTVRFNCDTAIALCGADMEPSLNGTAIPMCEAVPVKAGDVLTCKLAKTGLRSYLAIAGGFSLPASMGSLSTNLKCSLGGFHGRKLQNKDCIPLRKSTWDIPVQPKRLPANAYTIPSDSKETILVRVILGPQDSMFAPSGLRTFLTETYTVTPDSDRMGVRLDGTPIENKDGVDIISDGIVTGSIQVPASGQPIILMADRQTTGGYAKIATVIQADLKKIAQARPGTKIRFQAVRQRTAVRLLKKETKCLSSIVS